VNVEQEVLGELKMKANERNTYDIELEVQLPELKVRKRVHIY